MRFAAIALAVAPALVSAAEHTVTVGANNALAFDPPSTTAAVGDTVHFVFSSKNHSVTQSTFADPCTRTTANGTLGFGSGFQPVAAGAAPPAPFTITINNTSPIWFYCGQKIPVNHCAMGMVGAVNAPPDKTVDQFKAKAMASNGTSTNTSSSAPPAGSGAPAPAPASAAMRLGGVSTGLLTLLGLMAGLTL